MFFEVRNVTFSFLSVSKTIEQPHNINEGGSLQSLPVDVEYSQISFQYHSLSAGGQYQYPHCTDGETKGG